MNIRKGMKHNETDQHVECSPVVDSLRHRVHILLRYGNPTECPATRWLQVSCEGSDS